MNVLLDIETNMLFFIQLNWIIEMFIYGISALINQYVNQYASVNIYYQYTECMLLNSYPI